MKTPITFPQLILAWCMSAVALQGQQVAPPVEFSPQEAPKAAAFVDGGNPTNVFEAAISCLKTNGFSVIKCDRREFVVEVRNKKPGPSKDYDRVVLWLGRDAVNPAVIKVYILFGRYIEVFGSGGRLGRRVLRQEEEEEITGSWRAPLIEALERSGS